VIKMKTQLKKTLWKIIKIIWIVFGGLILFWTIYWYVQMHLINNLGVLALAVLFGIGIYLLAIYILITFVFFLIKWFIKKLK